MVRLISSSLFARCPGPTWRCPVLLAQHEMLLSVEYRGSLDVQLILAGTVFGEVLLDLVTLPVPS